MSYGPPPPAVRLLEVRMTHALKGVCAGSAALRSRGAPSHPVVAARGETAYCAGPTGASERSGTNRSPRACGKERYRQMMLSLEQ